jgi:glycosyltransferase involved in cell wall biosynthesis
MEVLFKASDITVLPYRESSQSGVMFMSYAFGKPVIVPRLGGFPDDVIEGTTGFLFEPGDALSLAKVLREAKNGLLGNEQKEQTIIRQFALNNYSWERTAQKLLEAYSDLLINPKRIPNSTLKRPI